MQLAILGRQPKLSIAELESIFGADLLTPVGDYACLVNVDKPLPQSRLGGTMKSARVLARLESYSLDDCFDYLAKEIPGHLGTLPEGKLQLGVSIYGAKAQKNWLLKQMLTLKKIIKKHGRSVRIIENKSEALESAVVLYNKLTSDLGWEFLIVKDGNDFILAQSTDVQNIDEYSKRDFDRPMRDPYVGMLPPKLAQIMINLSVGSLQESDITSPVILDAFCGTGVIAQEALLMNLEVIATDIEPRMIEYTQANISWLSDKFQIPKDKCQIYQADATSHHWEAVPKFVTCETYLGKPLSSLPAKNELDTIMEESNRIAERFLINISSQLKSGARLCIALPAWFSPNSPLANPKSPFLHLKMLDHLTDMGYTRIDLKHASKEDLIYHRPDQVVARELVILEKK
jgi:tRNA G10  N-methylase Trm11